MATVQHRSPTALGLAKDTISEEDRSRAPLHSRLLAFVQRQLRWSEGADDIVQDAFLRLTVASRREPIRNESAFLHTAALNLIRDRARAAATRRAVLQDDPVEETLSACEPCAERAFAGKQQFAVLEAALAELPMKRRAALVMARFDDLSHAEIADRLGISVSMVEKHIRLALSHCRRRLAEANGER